MMEKYNTNEVFIYNTVQLYRNDRINYIKSIIQKAKDNRFKIGFKLVRGAYHEKEIERSRTMNYNCPVHLKNQKLTMTTTRL